MTLTPIQRKALDILRRNGRALDRGLTTHDGDSPTIHYLTACKLEAMGLIKQCEMPPHCPTCECWSNYIELTDKGRMIANEAKP